jgi:CHAT domain-containing protein
VNSADPSALASEIASIRTQRQAAEMNQRKLQQQISELEANASSQKFISNLAVIKTPQASIFQQDDDTSKVLFRADPEDEFEVINVKGNWAHVRLENGADGWVRAAQLQRPQEVDDTEDAAAAANFSTPNQEIKPFAGDWTPLKGKPSLFVFAQPNRAIPSAILGQSQFAFAKHIFTEGYREALHSEQPMSGIVVVFLGDKGGVAAATLADIRRWRDGVITDRVFFERCSFDPPESFRDATAPRSVSNR